MLEKLSSSTSTSEQSIVSHHRCLATLTFILLLLLLLLLRRRRRLIIPSSLRQRRANRNTIHRLQLFLALEMMQELLVRRPRLLTLRIREDLKLRARVRRRRRLFHHVEVSLELGIVDNPLPALTVLDVEHTDVLVQAALLLAVERDIELGRTHRTQSDGPLHRHQRRRLSTDREQILVEDTPPALRLFRRDDVDRAFVSAAGAAAVGGASADAFVVEAGEISATCAAPCGKRVVDSVGRLFEHDTLLDALVAVVLVATGAVEGAQRRGRADTGTAGVA